MKFTKILCAALLVLLTVSLFAGCGESSGGKYVVLDENFGSEEYAIGLRKGDNAFTLKVQSVIDEMIADGTAGKISETWFGSDKLLKNNNFPSAIEESGDSSLDDIMGRGKIIMGLDVGFKPMGYYDDNGEIIGFDIDLAKEVATRMGVELVLQPIDWSAKELELNNGKIDLIWNGMSVTPDRVENMNISKPYLANRMIIIVADGSGIKTKADLAGKIVGVQAGSSALDAINGDADGATVATFSKISEFPDNPTAFLDLKAGRIDALVVDEVVGLNLIETEG
jgi:ABC-type amino acid transport/signal transduction systems, periplasmic component/domain